MTERSQKILETYLMRKTRKQKTAFLEFMKGELPHAVVEESGLFHSRNLIVGDLACAKVVLAAHYDTCAALPFPNLLMPKNILGTVLYALLLCIPVCLVSILLSTVAMLLTGCFWVTYLAVWLVFVAILLLLFAGPPNPSTVNDNTSGVLMLCELMEQLDEEALAQTVFVFFDNEENGLLGSSQFRKKHKKEMERKLLINFDCISDGDHILLMLSKKARLAYGGLFQEAFKEEGDKKVRLEKSATTLYPSDQMGFPVHAGVAAFRRNRLFGLYLGRIHTKRDTVLDENNIECIFGGMRRFLKLVGEEKF